MPRVATTFAALAALTIGLMLGIALSHRLARPETHVMQRPVARDLGDVPSMPDSAASAHRLDYFERINSIEEVLALPSDFAQSEALHALAGRADSAELQQLIIAAHRVANDVDRRGALYILFSRLTELDPKSALAMTRTREFEHDHPLRELVWQVWARSDLDGALAAAGALRSPGERTLAGMGLFAAHGYLGNDTTDRIGATLGIEPDRATRSRFLHALINRSPEQAVAHINSMQGGTMRDRYIWWLAYEMANREGAAAADHASLFHNDADARAYLSGVERRDFALDPRAHIETFLAAGNTATRSQRLALQSAITELAASDVYAALAYFDRTPPGETRQLIGSSIAAEYGAKYPAEALTWAAANDPDANSGLTASVLHAIAKTDPQFAIEQAQALDERGSTDLVSQVILLIGQRSPAQAATYVDLVPPGSRRTSLEGRLASQWLRADAESALNWILSREKGAVSEVLAQSAWALVNSNVDTAIRLLPQLTEPVQQQWRRQILEHLAQHRSVAEAEAFLHRFEDASDYGSLQTTFIQRVSQRDTAYARRLASEVDDPGARTSALLEIVEQVAQRSPTEATTLLGDFTDLHGKAKATAAIARAWQRQDGDAALRWVRSLANGSARDAGIANMAMRWQEQPTVQQMALVNSISDAQTRSQTKVRLAYRSAMTDPQLAKRLLDDPDISPEYREQVEAAIERAAAGYQ